MTGWPERRLAIVISLCIFGACGEKTTMPPTQIPPTMAVTPAGPITLRVQQTVAVVASTTGITGPVVTFTSSNPSVATVNGTSGVVACVAPGTTTITVRATGTDNLGAAVSLSAAVQVQCEGDAQLIDVSPPALTFSHTVGSTTCPQPIGSARVTNLSTASSLDVDVAPGNTALTLGSLGLSLGPGQGVDVSVTFNCSTQTSFSTVVTFTARSGAATDTKTVQVTGTISR